MNPEHDASHQSKIYNHNCTNVATAYELRRRGYDVTAAPIPGGRGIGESEYVAARWLDPEGEPLKMTKQANADAAVRDLEAMPDGARGYIQVVWKAGGAHVYNWEKSGGTVHYLEGQNPAKPDASGHLARARSNGIWTARLDNATMRGDAAAVAVQTRTPEYLREREQGLHLTSAQKKALSAPQFHLANGKIDYTPAKFRKNGSRWEPIPPAEQEATKKAWLEMRAQWEKDVKERAKK